MPGESPEPSDDARSFSHGFYRLQVSDTAAEQNINFVVLAEWRITWTDAKNVLKEHGALFSKIRSFPLL